MSIDVNRSDLDAYVDDQLDPCQRMVVERWLSRHPADAADVMADLCLKTELNMALALDTRTAGTDDRRRVRQLGRALTRPVWLGVGLPSAAVIVLLIAGWIALSPLSVRQGFAASPPPPFVESAVAAREASSLRLAMLSQPEAPDYDPAEILALTGLFTPRVPEDWIARDVQVFPSPQGPGLEMIFDTPEQGHLSVFVVRALGANAPGHAMLRDANLAWFVEDGIAHVVGTTSGPEPLEAAVAVLRNAITHP